ncbi:hypothetical protein [Ralstonia mannitolilytica]|uniref:hypothetical protein n=1 Tax=Ralstonia mannitolilytica TaxID=105219 RepID=UPI00215D7F48|nr:hypothetical protein [Ralstonia mannitolilytica]
MEEHIDLAVRIGELPGSTTLVARRLGVQDLSIGAAPSYLARHGTPVAFDDFAQHVALRIRATVWCHRGACGTRTASSASCRSNGS